MGRSALWPLHSQHLIETCQDKCVNKCVTNVVGYMCLLIVVEGRCPHPNPWAP